MDASLLISALENEDISELQRLLQEGVGPNKIEARDDGGYEVDESGRLISRAIEITPLCVAIKTNNFEAVQLLLSFGADPNLIPTSEETPLSLAASVGNVAVVAALILAGADLMARGVTGRTALLWAVRMNRPPVVDLLLQSGAEDKDEALRWALQLDRQTIRNILLAAGAVAPIIRDGEQAETPDIFANPRKFNRDA